MPSRAIPYLKALVHMLCILPLLHWIVMSRNGSLANLEDPVKFLQHVTGSWALWILLVDLAITPGRRLSVKLAWLMRFRRMVGLWAFFYATLHLLAYVFLFSGYDMAAATEGLRMGQLAEPWRQLAVAWPGMMDDLKTKRFIAVGLLTWVILLALAVTSPQRMLRWIGGKKWQRLHRLVYVAGFLACVHFWWQMKAGQLEPWKATAVLYVLLLARLVYWGWKKWQRRKKAVMVAV